MDVSSVIDFIQPISIRKREKYFQSFKDQINIQFIIGTFIKNKHNIMKIHLTLYNNHVHKDSEYFEQNLYSLFV